MFLSLLNRKEMLKFLDLAIYMVDIDGEATDVEKRVLNKMMAELDQIKDEYSFRLTDTAENTIKFFSDCNQVVKNVVYLNLVYITMQDDLYNTSELLFLEKIKRKKKTELCKNYELYKDCYYGDNCSFAHGLEELRDNIILPSYKTKLCKSFIENKTCNFGTRCSYQHKIM